MGTEVFVGWDGSGVSVGGMDVSVGEGGMAVCVAVGAGSGAFAVEPDARVGVDGAVTVT